jgi:beta-fructofuranosidase
LAPLDGAASEPGQGAVDRYAAWIGDTLPDRCMIELVVDIVQGMHASGLLPRCGADARKARSSGSGHNETGSCLTAGRGGGPLRRSSRSKATSRVRSNSNVRARFRSAATLSRSLLDGASGQLVVDHRVGFASARTTTAPAI